MFYSVRQFAWKKKKKKKKKKKNEREWESERESWKEMTDMLSPIQVLTDLEDFKLFQSYVDIDTQITKTTIYQPYYLTTCTAIRR